MIAVHVIFKIKSNCMAEFLPLMKQQAKNSLEKEPGCQRFDVCMRKEEPNIVYLYEVYESKEEFDKHINTEHYKRYTSDTVDLVAEKNVTIYDEILNLN